MTNQKIPINSISFFDCSEKKMENNQEIIDIGMLFIYVKQKMMENN